MNAQQMELLNKRVKHRRLKTQQFNEMHPSLSEINQALRETSARTERIDISKLLLRRPAATTLPNIFEIKDSIRDEARFQRKLGLVLHMRSTHKRKEQQQVDQVARSSIFLQSRKGPFQRSDLYRNGEVSVDQSYRSQQFKRREQYLNSLERKEELVRKRRSHNRTKRFSTVLQYLP